MVVDAHRDVFDERVSAQWAREFLDDPRHHLAAAIVDGQVVGMASAVHYIHPDKAPELWINEVGVADAYQRQGIGQRLMQCLLEHGSTLGCTEAWVLTEQANTASRKLYSSAGGAEETMVYVTFKLDGST